MRKAKRSKLTKKSLITRICVYSTISLLSIVSYCLCPKRILKEETLYNYYVKLADVDEKDDVALKEYLVYPTQKKFEQALPKVINETKIKYREENEILVVRIPGEKEIQRFEDYILIKDSDVPKLNIELCVAKNITYKSASFPVATFSTAANDISKKINYAYIPLLAVVHLAFLLPFGINDGLYIKELVSRRNQALNNND